MSRALHWEQRVALVRHNLHSASRSGDFTFFKSLQAQGLIEGTNHVATLSDTLGDDADAVLSGLDDLNTSIAYIHQDAFKSVYSNLKSYLVDENGADDFAGRSKVYVDATMQKQMADHAIDKTTSSAITLIQQQPVTVQEAAANVWITGNTITADCMEVCIKHIDMLEKNMNDFIRLEDSWETVKTSVSCTISALKGVYNLMAVESNNDTPVSLSMTFAQGGSNMFRRLSSAFTGSSAPPSRQLSLSQSQSSGSSRRSSLVPVYRTPIYGRTSVSGAVPTTLPSSSSGAFQHTQLSTIPPTPAAMDDGVNPFDTSFPVPPMPVSVDLHAY